MELDENYVRVDVGNAAYERYFGEKVSKKDIIDQVHRFGVSVEYKSHAAYADSKKSQIKSKEYAMNELKILVDKENNL
jgi:hypothetical protein